MADTPRDRSGLNLAVPDEVQALIVRYYDHALDEVGLSQLREALIHNEAARVLFVRWGVHAELLNESLSADYHEQDGDVLDGSPQVLAELARLEQQAHASMVQMHDLSRPWYAQRWAVVVGSAAAVFAIALVLLAAFSGPTDRPLVASNPDQPGQANPPAAPTPRTVATLTATHNAVWSNSAEGALAPGSDLHPGQTLILTAGFAEITTARGAIAVLEAPATIELINNDNAIELHSGRLVGICETPSSKGFLVSTPHLHVTDLGTRFGVDATNPDATEVHVLEGEVQVTRDRSSDPTARLRQGEAVVAKADRQGVEHIAAKTQAYQSLAVRRVNLPGTGHGLSQGDQDQNWLVVAIGGQPLDTPTPLSVGSRGQGVALGPNNPETSQLLLSTEQLVADQRSLYVDNRLLLTVRTHLDLPNDIDTSSSAVRLQFEADDQLARLRVNGRLVEAPENRYNEVDPQVNTMLIPGEMLKPGGNVIEFDVYDLVRSSGFMWGLRVQWQLETGIGSAR